MEKKINYYIFILLSLLCVSCDRHPLYLPESYQIDLIATIDADIDNLWNTGWRDKLKYNWDESIYGKIGYEKTNDLNIVFFNNDQEVYSDQLEPDKIKYINIDIDKTYNILLYNTTYTTYLDNYLIKTLQNSQTINNSNLSDTYDNLYEPGELYNAYLTNISFKRCCYDEMIIKDNKYVYLYHIKATLKPITYIYIFQFIIIDDDNTVEINSINKYSIINTFSTTNLFNSKSSINTYKETISDKINPMQQHNDSLIYASRMILMSMTNYETNSSWNINNQFYYIVMNIDIKNYGVISGVKDITQQILDNPYGGIITITLRKSELKQEEGKPSNFGIIVNDWKDHIYDIS